MSEQAPLISESNKRIAKNTLALYFRQIIVMVVGLFTTRIVLQTLGVIDLGINDVVGSVVAMFGFISGTLMSITQRFISVELGKGGDHTTLRKIFSTSMALHIIAAVIVLILAQTAGLWFLNTYLVIPEERMVAANWVYQFAVFGFALSLLNAPLMALVISHEDMHIFGFMGIFDVIIRLLTVYLLVIINADKLIFLAMFGFGVTCLFWLFYRFYCRWKYKYARFQWVWDKGLVKELSGFGGWVFGNSVFAILREQGITIMLNIFFGPAVNAARGLAGAVNMALLSFGNNFRQAIVPQITKSYAAKDFEATWSLVERGTRIIFFLFWVFSVPLLLKTEFVLGLWLGKMPEYTAIFVRFMIVLILTETFFFTLYEIVSASGKLRTIYCVGYGYSLLILIFSYLVLKMGYSPQYVFVVTLVLRFLYAFPVNFTLAKKMFDFPLLFFAQKAAIPIFFVSVISFTPFYFINKLFSESFFDSGIIITTSMLWTGIIVMFIGLRKSERVKIYSFVKRKFLSNGK